LSITYVEYMNVEINLFPCKIREPTSNSEQNTGNLPSYGVHFA